MVLASDGAATMTIAIITTPYKQTLFYSNLFAICVFCLLLNVSANDELEMPSPIIFIYDASGSMWGQIQGKAKMQIAAEVLTTAVSSLPENQKIGFVAYGHRKPKDCRDVEFMVDIDNADKLLVNKSILEIKPLGKTPLAYSAEQVINKLRTNKQKATIILVTDGIESCEGNICKVIKEAKDEGIDFKLHIVGFGLKSGETEQLECAAKAGDGQYYDAADANGLSEVINAATNTTIDEPAGNVSVYATKNGKALDVLVKAYDNLSKRKPILLRTYQNKAFVYLPPSTYNLEVLPLENTDLDMITVPNIQSFEDKIVHQMISFDAGTLEFATTNNGKYWDSIVKVIDQKGKVAASFRTYQNKQKAEINPGVYKVTIQALTLEGIATYTELEDVQLIAGEITTAAYDFKSGNFNIITTVENENIDTIVTIKEKSTGKNVAGSRTYTKGAKFLLNPGLYEVKVVPLGVNKGKPQQVIQVEVRQNEITQRQLNF